MLGTTNRRLLVPNRVALRTVAMAVVSAAVFGVTWLFRFNDPNGGFAGLTDDHFFYLVRGWQILFGDLPVRDFVDHGAPLYYYVAAAVQLLFGRGTLSELAFSATMIAAGAALTFWLAARASGSIALGLFGAVVAIWLSPRFYNYPKILVYTAAIPLLWWFVDRPGRWPRFWLAVTTVVGFLFRHDHGIFVAAAVAAALVLIRDITWKERLRHAVIYGALTLTLLAPYLLFIQLNGGVVSYFEQAASWAERERRRTEIVWPGLFDYPDGVSAETQSAGALARPLWVVRDNTTAWWYYFELALPFLAGLVLVLSRDAFRPTWVRAGPKVAVVAVLAVILNAGFLRSPLDARLADPSVPHAILIAWLAAALTAMFRLSLSWRPALQRWRIPLASAVVIASLPFAFVLAATLTHNAYDRIDSAGLAEGLGGALNRTASVARSLRADWRLPIDEHDGRSELLTLAAYLNVCTPPDARVFVQPYIPQVVALAKRAFAGGHADLRAGFFTSDDAQKLTIARLERQNVPVAILSGPPESYRSSFPLIGAYLQERYDIAATYDFDGRFGITLLIMKGLDSSRRFAPLDWPCLR